MTELRAGNRKILLSEQPLKMNRESVSGNRGETGEVGAVGM